MRSSLSQSQQSILKISLRQNTKKLQNSPQIMKKRVKSATTIKSQSFEKVINSTTRDEETTRAILDSMRLDNDCKLGAEDGQSKKIEQYKYQHEKDQCYISHLQQQIMGLEFQFAAKKDKHNKIMQPIKQSGLLLMQRIQTLELAKVDYLQELETLSRCLKEVLQHSNQIQVAYQSKCDDIEKFKSLRNIS